MTKKLLITAVCLGFLSAASFCNYFRKPEAYEIGRLRDLSFLFTRDYEYRDLKKELNNPINLLDVISKSQNFRIPEAGALEDKLKVIQQEIGDSKTPFIYRPVLKEFGEEI